MINYIPGSLARSRAGHDKDHIFIILKEDGEYVYLVDGKIRKLDNPKRKSKKHIQIINKTDPVLSDKLIHGERVIDEEFKRFIKCYKREDQL